MIPAHGTSQQTPPIDQFLGYLEHRRVQAQRQLDELARRRALLSPAERSRSHEMLRSRAAELTAELRRLRLTSSMTRTLVPRGPLSRS